MQFFKNKIDLKSLNIGALGWRMSMLVVKINNENLRLV